MNPWAWVAVAAVAAGALGWKLGRASRLLEVAQLHEVIEALRDTQDHRHCGAIIGRLSSYLLWQENRLDAIEGGPEAVIAEAERFLEGQET
jgi:hypothetical protein